MKMLFGSMSVLFVLVSILVLAKGDINLKAPTKNLALSGLLFQRHSVRTFSDQALTLEQLSLVLWAGQGKTSYENKRTAPSAMATYPLKIYVMVKNVTDVDPGIYLFNPTSNKLETIPKGENKTTIVPTAVKQDWIKKAPSVLMISYTKPKEEMGSSERTLIFGAIEVGAVMQNIYLMAESLDLGTCAVGGFDENGTRDFFLLSKDEKPMLLMPLGPNLHLVM